ncbi:YybH family protein [Bradyrhizobium betae]|uniref:DUF4440 domain-containing protein n=1 Tax=Bradyrhizobium betae TaxID=244734 RepID=A0A4Q1UTN4_9BRAD|nr:SgcJ/EcaC family oxidoreductase [Bradyrhizobium betae]RXT41878.1 hypothetical protein B5V03_25540 [Bradyrhizobium betae]
MKKLMKTPGETANVASAQADADRHGIEQVLQAYEAALNTSDADKVMTLFSSDAVFMPQHSPSSIGTDAIHAAYNGIFQSMTFDVELRIEEIVQVAPKWAFVRTNSTGFVIALATGERDPDANHELFVFQKGDDGEWQIARYCFSTTLPPRR